MTMPPQTWPTVPASPGPRHDWRIVVMSLAVMVLVVAGVAVYALGNRAPAGRVPATSQAHLERALLATQSAVTADVTVGVKVGVDGVSLTVSATGAVDFATKAASFQVNAMGQSISAIESSGVVYVKDAKLLGTPTTKPWVRMPLSDMQNAKSTQLFTTYDPQRMMDELVKLGATVTPIGTATIRGSRDEGYRVDLSVADLEAHAATLPPSLRSLLANSKTAPRTLEVSTTMYVDTSGRLQASHVLITGDVHGHQVTASVDVTMSNFGTATVSPAPPATQTVTYRTVQGALGAGIPPLTAPGSPGTQLT